MFDGDVYVGAMVKNYDDLRYTMTYGMVSKCGADGVEIVDVKSGDLGIPSPTDNVIASFANVSEMKAAGWVLD